MRPLTPVITALIGLCASPAQAQTACPWLTEGTAATALGGTPELAVKAASPQEGSCIFTLQSQATQSKLEIHIARQPPSSTERSCPAGSPSLVGIGNQAMLCHLASASNEDKQLVSSRVRDSYFSIVLTTMQADHHPDVERQRDRITMIAEQVAGNLF